MRKMFTLVLETEAHDSDLLADERVRTWLESLLYGSAVKVVECHEAPNFKKVTEDVLRLYES